MKNNLPANRISMNKIQKLLWSLKNNRKAQILLGVTTVLLISIIGIMIAFGGEENEEVPTEQPSTRQDTVNGLANRRIDGVESSLATSNILPVAIVVENLESVRPQSGLSTANVVYETLAEGGITRFMAVYANDETTDPIGPIRSARHYFVDWAEEYGGLFAHIGGSPQALGILGTTDYMTDLNQFGFSEYYYRDNNLFAPHNLFSSSDLMELALRDLNLIDEQGQYEPYMFKEEIEKNTTTRE